MKLELRQAVKYVIVMESVDLKLSTIKMGRTFISKNKRFPLVRRHGVIRMKKYQDKQVRLFSSIETSIIKRIH